jgi:ribonuclease-3
MEFLGDAVLGFVVSAWLLERFPELSEGKLSKMKAYLVSEASLVELAEAIELGRYILLNRGEEKTGGRRKRALLADAYEALIGVVYIDGGITTAERFLRRELCDKVKSINPSAMIGTDFKSALQEHLQAAGGPAPEYAVVDVLGPDHRRTFCIELRVGGRGITRSEGPSIKLAQQEAARRALETPEALAEAVTAYQERRAAKSNRHYIAEPVADAPPVAEPPSPELLAGWRDVCDQRLAVELGVAVLAAELERPETAAMPLFDGAPWRGAKASVAA